MKIQLKKLFIEALTKFLLGIVSVALLIFLPAGTLKYWNGWLFMAILFIPMFVAGIVMYVKKPELLERRLKINEEQKEQKIITKLNGIMFVVGFIVAGLDYRFGWSVLAEWISVVASFIFIVAYLLYAEVLRENLYLSRVIEIAEGQKVIDTGLYSFVRHPMYFITLFLFLAMPIVLGSLYSFLIFLMHPLIIVCRINNEEKLLEKELEGYREYKETVKYRLIPFLW